MGYKKSSVFMICQQELEIVKFILKKPRNLYKSESLTKNGGENYYFLGYFVIGENCHKEDRLFQCLK